MPENCRLQGNPGRPVDLAGTLLFLIFFLHALPGIAQTEDTLNIREFVYKEYREDQHYGFKEKRLDSSVLNREIYSNLPEILSRQSTVFIKSYGQPGIATPSFRGTGAGHTKVFWNGIPINSPMHGQVDLSLFPVALIDHAEIEYGGGNFFSRPGGLGGNLHLNNRLDQKKGWKISLLQVAGSFGEYQGLVGFGLGSEKIQSRSRVYYRKAGNDFPYRNIAEFGKPVERQKHARFFQYGGIQEVAYLPGKNDRIRGTLWYQFTDRQIPPLMVVPGSRQEQTNRNLRFTASWDHLFEDGRYSLKVSYLEDKLRYRDPKINLDALHTARTTANEFSIFYPTGDRGRINGGFTLDQSRVISEGYQGIKDQTRSSIFINYQLKPANILRVNLMGRKEYIDRYFAPFIPALGMEIRPFSESGFTLRTNVYRNYHAPALNDLYWIPGGNPDLEPEEGWGGEAGMHWGKSPEKSILKDISFDLSGYRKWIEGWILWSPTGRNFWEAKNLKKVSVKGLEGKLRSRWYFWGTTVQISSGYSYTRSENLKATGNLDRSAGKQLIYTPVHMANADLSIEKSGYKLAYNHTYTGKRFTTRDNTSFLEPYKLGRVSFSKFFQPGKFRLRALFAVENIWNEEYQSVRWRPMPGRSYHLAIRMEYRGKQKLE